MKVSSTSLVGLISLLASCTFAYPRPVRFDDGGPIEQKSRVTAFVNTDEGLRVECWEISDLLPETKQQKSRLVGSVQKIDEYGGELMGVDILTWPAYSPIYPPPAANVHATGFGFGPQSSPSSVIMQTGLLYIQTGRLVGSASAEQHSWVFAAENGDDWFYFEDSTTSEVTEANKLENHFNVRTISGTDTTLINFKYGGTPTHTVLHQGRCNFAGLKPVNSANMIDEDLALSRLHVQEL